jgi:hypothetical protein
VAVKLSTEKLKEMIGTWLSKPEVRGDLEHHSEMDDPTRVIHGFGGRPDETLLEYNKRMFEAPVSVSNAEELEEHIWKLWCDGSNWKRQEKHQLKDEAEDTFSETQYIGEWKPGLPGNQQERRKVPSFPNDMLGESNATLVEKYFNDPELAKKCVYRLFSPDNQLADNYRLEVITTHDDSEVVGWWVTVD